MKSYGTNFLYNLVFYYINFLFKIGDKKYITIEEFEKDEMEDGYQYLYKKRLRIIMIIFKLIVIIVEILFILHVFNSIHIIIHVYLHEYIIFIFLHVFEYI